MRSAPVDLDAEAQAQAAAESAPRLGVALPPGAPMHAEPTGLSAEGIAVFDDEAELSVIEDVPESVGAHAGPIVRRPVGRAHAIVERTFDVTMVLAFAPFWVPLYAVAATLIAVFDGRPIHYTERRVGRRGRGFTCVKFRSMLRQASQAPEEDHVGHLRFLKSLDDPRHTRLGRSLRRLSLDELPQLLNVLAGHMSLVGPRPITPREIERYYGTATPLLLSVRPGLTGLWQISGRSLLPIETRVRLDMEYVLAPSLWRDLTILVRTIPSVIRGHGAF